eukprot:TRINITY_DN811_c0_g1_i2.p1 TRINITY_DN811_c0_g1~~TRINITY_DN811_c0_g1_i2.p1  ORF type:complete len:885 (-),score=167.91 TRINITY_DN811_c0_g1_i2:328-2982(-)
MKGSGAQLMGVSSYRGTRDSFIPRQYSTAMATDLADSGNDTSKSGKLGTFLGVYVPTCNGVFGVVVFLRWGFAVGQAGFSGTLMMLLLGTIIAICTATSMSAIVTNGAAKGGGAYYFISRTLGPELGGAIGVQFYLSQSITVSFVCLGLAEVLKTTFGIEMVDGGGVWDNFILATLALLTALCLGLLGTKAFAKMSVYIFGGILFAVLMGVGSVLFSGEKSLENCDGPGLLGPSSSTFSDNWGADYDCTDVDNCPKNIGWIAIFSVVYVSMTGILSGANMSGDLKNPSVSIPLGTFLGIGTMFMSYFMITFSMALSVDRTCLRTNYQVLQDSCVEPYIVLIGTACSTFSTALGGIVGTAKILQAIASDSYIPRMSYFSVVNKEGEPVRAVFGTYILAQLFLLIGDVNSVAPFISNFMLLTFTTLNFACFLLDITGMPNFRPTYHYYSWPVALFGAIASLLSMFVSDQLYAGLSILFAVGIYALISHWKPKTSWGDISQAIIYHQVRKYLLRLDVRKDHVKFWRPQVLFFVSGQEKKHQSMASFCNDIKKGGLFVVAHVKRGNISSHILDIPTQRDQWLSTIDAWKVKAFLQLNVAPSLDIGVQNLVLSTGLGAMRPNTVAFGFPDEFRPNSNIVPSTTTSIHELMTSVRIAYSLNKNVILLDNFEKFDRIAIQNFIPHRTRPRIDLKKHGPKAGMTIDIWFLDDLFSQLTEIQTTVAMQLAHVFHSSRFWVRQTRIRVLYVEATAFEGARESFERLLDMTRTFADLVPVNLFDDSELKKLASVAGVEVEAGINLANVDEAERVYLSWPPSKKAKILNRLIAANSAKTAVLYLALNTFAGYMDVKESPVPQEDSDFLRCLGHLSDNLPPTALLFPTEQSVVTTEM